MKLRLLIFPFLLITIIWMLIWVIAPAYKTRGEKNIELATSQEKLTDILGKKEKSKDLVAEFDADTKSRDAIFSFLPSQKDEENLIESLYTLANSEGVSIFEMEIGKEDSVNTEVIAEVPTLAADGSLIPPAPFLERPKSFEIKLGVAGGYDKLRFFIIKVSKLKRFVGIENLQITKVDTESGDSSNTLSANISLRFNYLQKGKTEVDPTNPVFQAGKFDMSVVDDILLMLSTPISEPAIGTTSRTNPFMP